MKEDPKRRKFVHSTLMSAWNTLNKAHTLLMADPSSQPLAKEVVATMLKVATLAERQKKKS